MPGAVVKAVVVVRAAARMVSVNFIVYVETSTERCEEQGALMEGDGTED